MLHNAMRGERVYRSPLQRSNLIRVMRVGVHYITFDCPFNCLAKVKQIFLCIYVVPNSRAWTAIYLQGKCSPTHTALSRPQTINLYDGFVCHDAVVVVAVTSD